jgi:hypothetical protein
MLSESSKKLINLYSFNNFITASSISQQFTLIKPFSDETSRVRLEVENVKQPQDNNQIEEILI